MKLVPGLEGPDGVKALQGPNGVKALEGPYKAPKGLIKTPRGSIFCVSFKLLWVSTTSDPPST